MVYGLSLKQLRIWQAASVMVLLVVVQLLFSLLLLSHGRSTRQEIQALLRNEVSLSDPFLISQTINDLEAHGILSCPKLVQLLPTNISYLDLTYKAGCEISSYEFFGSRVVANLQAPNGSTWRIEFLQNTNFDFRLALWIVRVGGAVIATLLLEFYALRLRKIADINAIEQSYLNEFKDFALQTAHDIRSPIAALKVLASDTQSENDDRKVLIKSVSDRIQEIAAGLLDLHRLPARIDERSLNVRTKIVPTAVVLLLEAVLQEKRLQYMHRTGIKFEFFPDLVQEGATVMVEPSEFNRVISNIINNSIEAISDVGIVRLTLKSNRENIWLDIEDNGIGIAPNIIGKLCVRGGTFGKNAGIGLGLFHARKSCAAWGARVDIHSTLGAGTRVSLQFPTVIA